MDSSNGGWFILMMKFQSLVGRVMVPLKLKNSFINSKEINIKKKSETLKMSSI